MQSIVIRGLTQYDANKYRNKKYAVYVGLQCPRCKRERLAKCFGNDFQQIEEWVPDQWCADRSHRRLEVEMDHMIRFTFRNKLYSTDLLPGDEL